MPALGRQRCARTLQCVEPSLGFLCSVVFVDQAPQCVHLRSNEACPGAVHRTTPKFDASQNVGATCRLSGVLTLEAPRQSSVLDCPVAHKRAAMRGALTQRRRHRARPCEQKSGLRMFSFAQNQLRLWSTSSHARYLQSQRYPNEMQNICHLLMGQDTSAKKRTGKRLRRPVTDPKATVTSGSFSAAWLDPM